MPIFIPRKVTQPPGHYDPQTTLSPTESLKEVQKSALTTGAKKLLTGLLLYGGVMDFPKGRGLDYAYLLKDVFRPEYIYEALREFAGKLRGKVDAIIGPQQSAIAPAAILAAEMNVPFVRVVKNMKNIMPVYSVSIESYTSGTVDVLSIPKKALQEIDKVGGRAFKLDDIIDTGGITLTMKEFVKQAQSDGLNIKLIGVGALFEKSYTHAAKLIKQNLGFTPISSLIFEDMGFDEKGKAWIKVKGIQSALRFE